MSRYNRKFLPQKFYVYAYLLGKGKASRAWSTRRNQRSHASKKNYLK